MIYALPLTALAITAVTGVLLGRARRGVMVLGLFLLLAFVFAYCIMVAKSREGYDDIGYAIVAFLVALPGGAGLLGGALIGWLLQRHRKA